MKNITCHIGTLEIVERLKNSTNGNPRYLLRVDGWTCVTPVDSSLGYQVPNLNGKQVKASIGTFRNRATLNTAELV